MSPSIALVVALASERRALQRCLPPLRRPAWGDCRLRLGAAGEQPLAVIQAGIGPGRARSALLAAARQLSLAGAWSLGFAGGLGEDLRPGDLVCPEAVLGEVDGVARRDPASPGCRDVGAALIAAGLRTHAGDLLTLEAPLWTREAKRAAFRRTGALAVDMEAAGVAAAARELGIPWLALKAVLDPVGEPLPEFLEGVTTAAGNLNWAGLLASLAARERRQALLELRRAAARAAASLRRGLPVALREWAALTPTRLSG